MTTSNSTTKIDDGGPAFPRPAGPIIDGDAYHGSQSGMTLRDYFAAMLNPNDVYTGSGMPLVVAEALLHGRKRPDWDESNPDTFLENIIFWMDANAAWRYMMADAMLAAKGGGK